MFALVISICLAPAQAPASCTEVNLRSDAIYQSQDDCMKAGASFWSAVGNYKHYPAYFCDGPH